MADVSSLKAKTLSLLIEAMEPREVVDPETGAPTVVMPQASMVAQAINFLKHYDTAPEEPADKPLKPVALSGQLARLSDKMQHGQMN